MQRRLAAILACDVVGYSRLMERDEEGTLARLKELRRELLDPQMAAHGGRTVKLMGDGALVEFGSVVGAVQCAIDIQTALAERNARGEAAEAIWLRVGINQCDVIVEGDDLYGDGVNIAARLEGMAETGGICLADDAYRQVRGRIDAVFRDAGELQLKNIAEPLRAWRWRPQTAPVSPAAPAPSSAAPAPSSGAPERPSIVVLPFSYQGGDAGQDYFADGLTEDLISGLSRFKELFVIGRSSSFVYKDKVVRPQDLARELAVRYVAQGSVRRSGRRLRITIELVDALTGNHLWGERYDREIDDLFDLEDDITRRICATLPGRLEQAEASRALRKPTGHMAAYECLARGKLHHHRGTQQDNAQAMQFFDQALALDPNSAEGYAWKACTIGQALYLGIAQEKSRAALVKEGQEIALRGLSLDENNAECHRILCEIAMIYRDWDAAQSHHERAFGLNPNDPRIVAQRGELLTWLGKSEEGIPWIEQAMQLDPYAAPGRARLLGRALFAARRYADAATAFKRASAPGFAQCADLAACYAALGEIGKAQESAAEALRIKPDLTAGKYVQGLNYREPEDARHHREALIKAGVPE